MDSIRKNLSSPIGRFIPVPAPAPDDSTPKNSSFFDTLSSELELEDPKVMKGDSSAKPINDSKSPDLLKKDSEPVQVEIGYGKLDDTKAAEVEQGPEEEPGEEAENHSKQDEESNPQESIPHHSKSMNEEEEVLEKLNIGSDLTLSADQIEKVVEPSEASPEVNQTPIQNPPETLKPLKLPEEPLANPEEIEISALASELTRNQSNELPISKMADELVESDEDLDLALIEGLDEVEALLSLYEDSHEPENQEELAIPAVTNEPKLATSEISTEAVGRVLKDAEVEDSTVDLKKSVMSLSSEPLEEEEEFLQELNIAEKGLLSTEPNAGALQVETAPMSSELDTTPVSKDESAEIIELNLGAQGLEEQPKTTEEEPVLNLQTELSLPPEEIVNQAENKPIQSEASVLLENNLIDPSLLISKEQQQVTDSKVEILEISPLEQEALVEGESRTEETSEIVDQIMSLFENIESLRSTPELREKLSRLVSLIQNLVEKENVSIPLKDGKEKEQFLSLLTELRQSIEHPNQKSGKSILSSISGQEMLSQVHEILVQSLDNYKGKIELGQEFELVDSVETQDKKAQSKSKLLNQALIESVQLDEETEILSSEKIQSTKRSIPLSPLESGTQNSKAADALARLALKIAGEYSTSSNSSTSEGAETSQQGDSKNSGGEQGRNSTQESVLNLAGTHNSTVEGEGFENVLLNKAKMSTNSEMEMTHLSTFKDQAGEPGLVPSEGAKTSRVMTQGAARVGGSTPFQQSIMKQVLHQVRALRPPKVNVLRVTLNPRELGQVKVEIKNAQEGLKIRFQAENMAVKDVIDRNVGQLRDSMKAQGLDINKIEVEVREESTNDQGNRRGEKGREEKSRKKNKGTSEFSLEEQTSSNESDEHKINEYA